VRLNWRRRMAKEWLWLISLAMGAGLLTIIILVVVEEHQANLAVGTALFFLILGAFFFLRITFWAIKEVRKKGS
jgi:hypothetical protein